MIKFRTEAATTLRTGVVELTKEQARRRTSALKQKGKTNKYEIVAPVQIKTGEVIGLSACPKGMEDKLTDIVKEQEENEARIKAAEEAEQKAAEEAEEKAAEEAATKTEEDSK